jgi:hypothetical protein
MDISIIGIVIMSGIIGVLITTGMIDGTTIIIPEDVPILLR